MKSRLYVALLHHPVVDKHGRVVTTSITNIDVHDIARSARTFGVRRFYVVHPIPGLRSLAERIVEHWRSGYGSRYNPSRHEAIGLVEVAPDLDHVLAAVEQDGGRMPRLVATSARERPGAMSYEEMARRLAEGEDSWLLLFGTGYGMADEIFARCDALLEPVRGVDGYNHLSVRSAAAIVLDRLTRTR
ncbi:MAG TPA: RNA methyltransferase [Candidatus Binatia bacterium]